MKTNEVPPFSPFFPQKTDSRPLTAARELRQCTQCSRFKQTHTGQIPVPETREPSCVVSGRCNWKHVRDAREEPSFSSKHLKNGSASWATLDTPYWELVVGYRTPRAEGRISTPAAVAPNH
ncbi:unnamed protein product [Boreogadus saida]